MKLRNKLFFFFAVSALLLQPVMTYAEPTPNPTGDPSTETPTTPTPTPSSPTAPTSDGYLKSLSVAGVRFNQNFSKTVNEYTATVTSSTTSVNISATTEVDTDTINEGDLGFKNLQDGENVFKVNVKTASGKTNTYTIKITRATTNLNLKSLTVVGATLNEPFKSTTYNYTVDVTYNVEAVTIRPEVEDESATATVSGSTNLSVGKNTIRVLVKNSAGESQEYRIIVTRGTEDELNEEDEPGSIVSSVDEVEKSDVVTPVPDNNPGKGNTLTYILVVVVCIILLTIGIVGIYFYVKTKERSEKSKQKRIEKLKKKQQKIEEELTGLMPVITREMEQEHLQAKAIPEESPMSEIPVREIPQMDELEDTIELEPVTREEDIDFEIEPQSELKPSESVISRNVLEEFDDLFLDE